jgi:hypothetical protein
LESTKHRQSKEIRDLRRKLRESRLILPPRAYRAVKATLEHDDTEDEDDEDEMGPDDVNEQLAEDDEMFKRIRLMVEDLIDRGKRALETKPDDFSEGSAKVLSADEVRSWQGSDRSVDHEDHLYGHSEQEAGFHDSPLLVASLDHGYGHYSPLEEMERSSGLMFDPTSPSTPPHPPINIIPST